jgi:hypothetical protein
MSSTPPRGRPAEPAADEVPWRELVASIGSDIAGPLTEALERVNTMATSGRIDRDGLRQLRSVIEQARQVGMTAQQLTRFASRRVRLSHERLQLDELLRDVLRHRGRELQAHGLALAPEQPGELRQAEVLADASLLFSLLNTLVDWALRHARAELVFGLSLTTWPAHARLSCRFRHRVLNPDEPDRPSESIDSLTWRLLEQIAQTLDLIVKRELDEERVTLWLEFPRTANASMEGVSSIELSDGSAQAPNSMPLVGSHVLVVASRRDVRLQIRDAIHHMGLLIDLVSSVEEAVEFCRDSLPHALIVEGILSSERLARLRTEIWAEVPDFAFIEIVEEGDRFEMSDASTGHIARVGREALETSLSSVLLFELSKGL